MVIKNGLAAIIVLYNCSYNDSPTYLSCLSAKRKGLISSITIVDNSTANFFNQECQVENAVFYRSMNGNKGLSKAYNEALAHIREEYVVFFDDDTVVPEMLFDRFSEEMKRGYDICFPRIECQIGTLSPSKIKGCRTYPYESAAGDITAINSCMSVRTDFARKVGYEEQLFLDMVDHDFMKRARNNNPRIVYLSDVICQQDYSEFADNKDAALVRFSIKVIDLKTFGRLHSCSLMASARLIWNSAKNVRRYRNLRFFTVALLRHRRVKDMTDE